MPPSPLPDIMPIESGKAGACEALMRALPEWFGIEQALLDIARDAESQTVWVARDADRIVGCIAIKLHNEFTAEMALLAVRPDHHRTGIGRRLVLTAESWLRARGIEYLSVKTLGPSRPDPGYERTRRFYAAMGFRPVEETTAVWGPDTPCLIMIKRL